MTKDLKISLLGVAIFAIGVVIMEIHTIAGVAIASLGTGIVVGCQISFMGRTE